MVEEIVGAGFENVGGEHPSAIRDGDSELMLFVALSLKREEPTTVRSTKLLQRAPNCEERRRLIVVAVEGAEGPIQAGDIQRCAETRTDGVLRHSAAEVRGAHSRGKRQPGHWFEFVVDEESFQTAGSRIALGKRGTVAAVVEDNSEELAVILAKPVKPRLKFIFRQVALKNHVPAPE